MSARSLLNVSYNMMVENMDEEQRSDFDYQLALPVKKVLAQRKELVSSLGEIGGR